jgi:hypothetical protein
MTVFRSLFVLVPTVLFATGCASIVSGSNQSLSVETRTDSGPVSGVNCRLSNNKGTWFVTSPGSTTVNRSFEDLAVKCEKDGMEPGLLSVKSGTKAMAFGNILFGGVIGAGVDISTGAAYDYPPLIVVMMGKTGVATSQPAASNVPQGQSGSAQTATDPAKPKTDQPTK